MAVVSKAKRLSIKKYQQDKTDRIAADIPKGKKDLYKRIAQSRGLSLSQLIQAGVEFYATHGGQQDGEKKPPVADDLPKPLSASDQQLLDDFAKLPADLQTKFRQLIKFINQCLNQSRN